MADQPLFGSAPAVSPEALKTRRNLAAALQMQGQDASPIRSPWQGVARMVQSAMGGYEGYQSDQAELAARQASAAHLAKALQGNDLGGTVAAMSDPFTNPEAAKLSAALLTPQQRDTGLGTLMVNRFGQVIPNSYIPKQQIVPQKLGNGLEIPTIYQGTGPEGGVRELPIQQGPQAPSQPYSGQYAVVPNEGQASGATGVSTSGPLSQRTQQLVDYGIKMSAERERQTEMAKKAGDIAMTPAEEIAKEIRTAPQALNALNIIEDVAKQESAKGTTTGLAGEPMLKLRQTVNGLAGQNVMGDTAGPETMSKMNAYLASAATQAMTARGTQFDFKVNMANQPGNLMNSWKGTLYLSNVMKQIHRQNIELGQELQKSGNVYNSAEVIKNYYDTHPLVDPVTGNKLGVSQDTREQKGGRRMRVFNTQTGEFDPVTQ